MEYKATVRRITETEAASHPETNRKLRENIGGNQPNDEAKDDNLPGDIPAHGSSKRSISVTKVREVEGYKIERRNPYGFWYVSGLEQELGTFVGFSEAEAALTKYLKDQDAKSE